MVIWAFVLAAPMPVTVIMVPKPALLLAQVQLFPWSPMLPPSARGWCLGQRDRSGCSLPAPKGTEGEGGGWRAEERKARDLRGFCVSSLLATSPYTLVVIKGPWSPGPLGCVLQTLLAGS